MATLDWSQCPAVESIPGKRSGAWVFKGTRTPVATVFENLQDMSVDELVEEFGVTREQVQAVLEFAAHSAEAQCLASVMLVLFDNGTPRTLARYLIDRHMVTEARARGWEELENGELLNEAEAAGSKYWLRPIKIWLPAEPRGPQDSHCRIGARPLEPHQAVCGADCRSDKRSDTRQFCRSRNPSSLLKPRPAFQIG